MIVSSEGQAAVHDRALLLHGSKRNEILTLAEVQQYGIDSFADPNYIRHWDDSGRMVCARHPSSWPDGRGMHPRSTR